MKGKTIAVTGGLGFIGSHLVEALVLMTAHRDFAGLDLGKIKNLHAHPDNRRRAAAFRPGHRREARILL